MIDIVSFKGELYRFDPDTERIFKDGVLLDPSEAEPVYSNVNRSPEFAGIELKNINSILSRSGKINEITDTNQII